MLSHLTTACTCNSAETYICSHWCHYKCISLHAMTVQCYFQVKQVYSFEFVSCLLFGSCKPCRPRLQFTVFNICVTITITGILCVTLCATLSVIFRQFDCGLVFTPLAVAVVGTAQGALFAAASVQNKVNTVVNYYLILWCWFWLYFHSIQLLVLNTIMQATLLVNSFRTPSTDSVLLQISLCDHTNIRPKKIYVGFRSPDRP